MWVIIYEQANDLLFSCLKPRSVADNQQKRKGVHTNPTKLEAKDIPRVVFLSNDRV